MFKSTALLTVAIFFAIAPSPDAQILSDITGGFLKADVRLNLTTVESGASLQTVYIKSQSSAEVVTGF